MKAIGVVVLLVTLAACASPYQPYSYFGGGGYRDIQLSENSFRVTFEGNGYTRGSQAADMALLRAADLALEKGFSHFVVVGTADNSRSAAFTTPTTTTATATVVGNTAYGRAQTYGGQTFFMTFPTPTLTILCFREKPAIEGMVYDAAITSKSLKAQYFPK